MPDRDHPQFAFAAGADAGTARPAPFEPELDPSHEVIWPESPLTPLVVSSPHSGNVYPARFLASSRLDPLTLRRSEDAYVDELFGPAASLGAPLLRARFPRAYLDLNREPYELDPRMFDGPLPSYANTRSMRVAGGLGTIARVVGEAQDIYSRRLPVSEGLGRIEALYRPYHAALRALLESALEHFGQALLLDCHSMPSSAILADVGGGRKVDIVLGDRYGTAANQPIVDLIEQRLRQRGYSVRRNKPYAGGFITEYYGNPASNCHAVQIEVNRGIYMNEKTMERGAGFVRLSADLKAVAADVIELLTGRPAATPMAAE